MGKHIVQAQPFVYMHAPSSAKLVNVIITDTRTYFVVIFVDTCDVLSDAMPTIGWS